MFRILSSQGRASLVKHLRQSSALPTHAPAANNALAEKDLSTDAELTEDKSLKATISRNLVSAAFEKLKTLGDPVEVKDSLSKAISEAKNLEELLVVVTMKKLTKNHALKVVATLSDWLGEGKIKAAQFERDQRFLSVCQVLGSKPVRDKVPGLDLNTVLDIASDDEAAKHIANISHDQRIKVLSALACQKRRSTPMLRSLAHNIASGADQLDIKQGADALYAVASLNYHDEMLLDKICSDLCLCLMANSKRAVVGSIVTSLGILRFKHIELLNLLCEWTQTHIEVCTSQDLASLVMTMAVLNHHPLNQDSLFPLVMGQLEMNVSGPLEWLDVVWALTVLNKQSAEQVSSVLAPDFLDKIQTLSSGELSIPTKLKLLNINGAAKLRLKDYKGAVLDVTQPQWRVALLRSKDKQALVAAMQETMLSLLPSAVYLNTNTDLGMGFLIDAECLMNSKLVPLPLFDKKTKAPIERSSPDTQPAIKVAVLVCDYHDMTRGRREPTGMSVLCQDLARHSGYRIMLVDHLDFNPRHKLVNRVQYLSSQLKTAVGKT